MKSKKPTKFQKFLLFVFAVFVIHRVFFRAPSEAEMIAKFRGHKAEFEQIRLMLQQDKNVAAIGPDSVRAASGPDEIQSPQNIKQGIISMHELPLIASGLTA